MTISTMLLLLAFKEPQRAQAELIPAPQVVCPLSLKEYAKTFRWWARADVIARQKRMAEAAMKYRIQAKIALDTREFLG